MVFGGGSDVGLLIKRWLAAHTLMLAPMATKCLLTVPVLEMHFSSLVKLSFVPYEPLHLDSGGQ